MCQLCATSRRPARKVAAPDHSERVCFTAKIIESRYYAVYAGSADPGPQKGARLPPPRRRSHDSGSFWVLVLDLHPRHLKVLLAGAKLYPVVAAVLAGSTATATWPLERGEPSGEVSLHGSAIGQ